ncbi:MAG: tetratricopeptide repeat protein [Desulfobacterales bacterium]|nr:tetratricopeptide repeat protein [Desulfobacterales bacterium]
MKTKSIKLSVFISIFLLVLILSVGQAFSNEFFDGLTTYEKATFSATYGNDKAAIVYFNKAIKEDPANIDAYFYMGISYGELGEYGKAISSITVAINLSPDNGNYYFGRGRIYMMSGDQEKAMADITQAATLGNKDAINYLDR